MARQRTEIYAVVSAVGTVPETRAALADALEALAARVRGEDWAGEAFAVRTEGAPTVRVDADLVDPEARDLEEEADAATWGEAGEA